MSLLFKRLRVVRMVDAKRNTLVYLSYSDKLIDGSPQNSITAVPELFYIIENEDQSLLYKVLDIGVGAFVAAAHRAQGRRQQIDHLPLRLPVVVSAGL